MAGAAKRLRLVRCKLQASRVKRLRFHCCCDKCQPYVGVHGGSRATTPFTCGSHEAGAVRGGPLLKRERQDERAHLGQ